MHLMKNFVDRNNISCSGRCYLSNHRTKLAFMRKCNSISLQFHSLSKGADKSEEHVESIVNLK